MDTYDVGTDLVRDEVLADVGRRPRTADLGPDSVGPVASVGLTERAARAAVSRYIRWSVASTPQPGSRSTRTSTEASPSPSSTSPDASSAAYSPA
ncbi:hypothetical protein [Streptomyces exfoliatus]|uniref:hypothetical protein n=1 Tax=Streptomyces exfoliatus TaxID=1905 RepID=UPI0004CB8041|nr:hypothetical protein [Streptomyces exfoliatus]